MYHEISCYGRTDTEDDIREAIFLAMKKSFVGISLFPYFFASMKDFLLEGMVLSCPIDFPYGNSDVAIRSHAIISAIRKGANTIDLVANNNLLSNKQCGKFYDDIQNAYNICKEYKVVLRIILEYRLYEESEIIRVGNGIREIGIEYVIPATGTHIDAYDDNLGISLLLTEKSNIKAITNGNIWTIKQYKAIKSTHIFGIRFNSVGSIKNIFA